MTESRERPSLAHCFIRSPNSDRIKFTRSGRERFQQRFAEVGINIEHIITAHDLIRAHTLCLHHDLRIMRDKTTDPALKQWLTTWDT